ncbi:MAG: hypothetical protein HFG26_02895 [Provencibacterium sp.]|nr:hypothetical protein [Provencibacterium sp.]
MAYDGATQKLSVTIGSDTFESAVLTDNAANLGGQDITLTNGNGETITVKTADTVSEIGKDKTGNIASTVIGTLKPAADNTNGGAGNALILQIGEDGQQWNKMDVAIEDMHIVSLFAQAKAGVVVQNTNETDPAIMTIDISSQDAASNALDSIREAVNTVSTQRSKLGAIQNRLEHTINNLDVASENMNSANSRVRDTDMAKQMMSYTQMNVLTQAAQAMLAQANQQPQSVLQLLQ